jgi:hypothetical protein
VAAGRCADATLAAAVGVDERPHAVRGGRVRENGTATCAIPKSIHTVLTALVESAILAGVALFASILVLVEERE